MNILDLVNSANEKGGKFVLLYDGKGFSLMTTRSDDSIKREFEDVDKKLIITFLKEFIKNYNSNERIVI